MSNQINPFNWNIDNFDSGFLGPISDGDFRTFLFTHSLVSVNPIVGGVLGGNPWADRGTEYDLTQSTFNVVDIPNLTDVATQPSFYNNLTEPRPDNLSRNLQQVNQQVVDNTSVSSTDPDQEGRNVDATTLLDTNPTIIDLPTLKEVSDTPSFYNNYTKPKQDNLDKNPTKDDLISWYPYQNYISLLDQEYDTYNTDWTVPSTLKIGYVGNVDEWLLGGNVIKTSDVRDRGYYMLNNVYGPKDIVQYSTSDNRIENTSSVVVPLDKIVTETTGFKQYNTKVSGDFRDALLSRSLGVGIIPFSQVSSGINYEPIEGGGPSELDKEARKRRGIELKNRIKLNFVDDTLGILNTNVFGILAGGSLLNRDFSITRPKSTLGKVADFIANLTGFNYPKSILQPGDLNLLSYNKQVQVGRTINPLNIDEIDVPEGLLDRTGKATREVILDSMGINKYGPNLDGDYKDLSNGTYLTNDDNLIVKQNTKGGPIPTESVPTSTNYGGFFGRNEATGTQNSFSDEAGFGTVGVDPLNLPWGYQSVNYKKGLLKYTQDIVNKTLEQSVFKQVTMDTGYIGYFDSPASFKDGLHITGSKNPQDKPTLPSKGNMVRNIRIRINKDTKTVEGGDLYCRSWTKTDQYDTFKDLVRSSGNWWRNANNLPTKNGNSMLTLNYNNTGIPKITWTKQREDLQKVTGQEKNIQAMMIPYMFSIENLAWKSSPHYDKLPISEKGPNGGRIMWFPPYGLNVSESNSVNWDPTNFIGRGEPIYTYNHSERSGTLDFMVIVDHPSVLNQLRDDFVSNVTDNKTKDSIYHSFFAGCNIEDLKELFKDYLPESNDEVVAKQDLEQNVVKNNPVKPTPPKPPPYNEIKIYFENCKDSITSVGRNFEEDVIKNEYEVTKSSIILGTPICNGAVGLNVGVEDKLKELSQFLVGSGKYNGDGSGKNYKINVEGYTSPANPTKDFNQKLGKDRADSVFQYLNGLMELDEPKEGVKLDCGEGCNEFYPLETEIDFNQRWSVVSKPSDGSVGSDCTQKGSDGRCLDGDPCSSTPLEDGQSNSKKAKEQRYVKVSLTEDLTLQTNILKNIKTKEIPKETKENNLKNKQEKDARTSLIGSFITEMNYFSNMKENAKFVYDSLHEKIQNFHPAFHSMTPEGLNSRLTFLLQCTRQGPQIVDQNDNPQNMVFGRPPICVLRIGDFYHTKIVIDSVNITYEPLQWDLNPEGIGVQPMIAKVSLGFKFIGGSSLGGPIQQLQNAVSYNFFANTSVYRPIEIFNQFVEEKNKIIKRAYGSWLTPKDADDFYSKKVAVGVLEEETTTPGESGNNDTSNVSTDDKTKKEIEDSSSKNLEDGEKTTDGNDKPKTTTPKEKVDVGQIIVNADGTVTVNDINTTVKKGGTHRVLYTLVNKMTSPVIITNVSYSDCPSCTKPASQFPKQPVLKNQTVDIWVYDIPKIDLYTQKSATINLTTNVPKSIVIKPIIKPE